MSKTTSTKKPLAVNGRQLAAIPATSTTTKSAKNEAAKAVRNKALTQITQSKKTKLSSERPTGNGKANTNQIKSSKKGAQINGLSSDGTMKMEKRLQKRSPWYMSLRDPVQGAGARIPDLTGINTATFQSVQVVSVTTNAAGMNGLQIISPYICNTPTGIRQICPINTAATPSAVLWATAATGGNSSIQLAAQNTIVAVAQSHRVVSAAIFAEYEGATLSDTGEATSFVAPYENATSSVAITQTYSSFQANYGSSVVPLNKARSRPLVSYWFPISLNTWEYSDFQSTDNGEWNDKSTNGTNNFSPFWSFGHIMTGITGTPTVKYIIVINYEFVPRFNTLDYIAASPSPIDPIEEQLVEQWVQQDAQTGMSNNKLVDVQPGAQKTDEASQGMSASNMFGMFGSIVKEVLPMLSLL